jgi:hypothetical protein
MQKAMSAVTPKADMCGANSDIRYWPKADIREKMKEAARGSSGL